MCLDLITFVQHPMMVCAVPRGTTFGPTGMMVKSHLTVKIILLLHLFFLFTRFIDRWDWQFCFITLCPCSLVFSVMHGGICSSYCSSLACGVLLYSCHVTYFLSFSCYAQNKLIYMYLIIYAVPAVGSTGYYNYIANNHLSAMNQERNTNNDVGHEKQLNLQMSLNYFPVENLDRLARIGNPSAVSTGLRLSYENNEHTSITSGSGNMSSLPIMASFVDEVMAELDKENKEFNCYFGLQVFNAYFIH